MLKNLSPMTVEDHQRHEQQCATADPQGCYADRPDVGCNHMQKQKRCAPHCGQHQHFDPIPAVHR
jgi:hypothetical protein